VLHGENDDENNVLEVLLVHAEQSLRAVFNHVHHKSEETSSEIWVELKFILDNSKRRSTKTIVNDRELIA